MASLLHLVSCVLDGPSEGQVLSKHFQFGSERTFYAEFDKLQMPCSFFTRRLEKDDTSSAKLSCSEVYKDKPPTLLHSYLRFR